MSVEIAGRRWRVAPQGYDISIPLAFDAPQPRFFGASPATETALAAGSFTGEVRRGGSCNCSTYTITPHCNGTHTECIGHLTAERISIRDVSDEHLSAALLISVTPEPIETGPERPDTPVQAGDRLITRALLASAALPHDPSQYRALIVRTLPNEATKLHRNYDSGNMPPYFSADAMDWIARHAIRQLVVDLPSVDRASDEGRLTAHRIFWGMPPGATALSNQSRRGATITELAFIDDSIPDGPYLLNLQVAPFVADAAPSRPILIPLSPA